MKCWIITKKQIMLGISLLATAAVLVGSLAVFAGGDRQLPIYCVQTEEKKIAISFDAAWGNDDTQTLIDILHEYNVPATFFVVGAWVDKYPESVKQLSDAGMQVMNHSNTHPYMSKLSTSQIQQEISDCNQKIAAITGREPTLFRPPYGDYDNHVVETVRQMGMEPIQWSVDSLDWKDSATPESICERVTQKVRPGSIVLFHNDATYTPKALSSILKCLQDQGYEFVMIDDLICHGPYTLDHSGMQIPATDSGSSQTS